MFTHLFDTSAVVHLYLPEQPKTRRIRARAEYLVQQRTLHRKATLLIPSFCIAEGSILLQGCTLDLGKTTARLPGKGTNPV